MYLPTPDVETKQCNTWMTYNYPVVGRLVELEMKTGIFIKARIHHHGLVDWWMSDDTPQMHISPSEIQRWRYIE